MTITSTPANDFGAWLLARFREKGWESYRDATKATGISHSQWRAYVGGAVPRARALKRISEIFGVPRHDLERLLGIVPLQPTPAVDATRDLIREVVHETLDQLGVVPRSDVEGMTAHLTDALRALPPDEREAFLGSEWWRKLQQLRPDGLAERS